MEEALIDWEPRIIVQKVQVTADMREVGRLLANIEYRVRTTNVVHNLVYPFYLDEGS